MPGGASKMLAAGTHSEFGILPAPASRIYAFDFGGATAEPLTPEGSHTSHPTVAYALVQRLAL